MRLRVDLKDKDLINDDGIATVDIIRSDIARAYDFGKSFQVHVGDQDTGSAKFVAITVTPGESD